MRKKPVLLTMFPILLLIIMTFSGCIKQPLRLDNVEIREYNGEQLSSVNDFHENSIKGTQFVNKTTYRLNITGLVTTPRSYTYEEVITHFTSYFKVVTLHCVEGWSVTLLWKGVLIDDLLAAAQPQPTAKTLIFKAVDGYTTSFPINYTGEHHIILAYTMNNVTLPPERGFPFQLVAESKWGYKWIRWITDIEVSDNENYKGYWESRGYSNSGDLNKSIREE